MVKLITITKELFGDKIDFIIIGTEEEVAIEVVEEVYLAGLSLHKIFDFYDPQSELSLLNNLRTRIVSKELLNIIKKAIKFSKRTMGNYDVALGKYISMRKKGKVFFQKCSYKDILIEGNKVSLTHPDVMIDLGSIAKGYITDKITELLQKKGIKEFVIDARGDISARGKLAHIFEVQDPRSDKSVCSIKLKNQAVATSGDYKQYSEEFSKSHILNQKETTSVTVVTSTLEEADVYATVLFTCSQDIQNKILTENKNIKTLIINKDNKINLFNGFKQLLYNTQ